MGECTRVLIISRCDGNLKIQEAGTPNLSLCILIGAFCRKDQHRESQGSQSEDAEQSNARILYRRTKVVCLSQFKLVL